MLLWVVFNTVHREGRQTVCKVKLDVRVSWQRTSWKWLFMNVYSGRVQRWEVLPRLIQFTIHSLWVSTDYHIKYIEREKGGGIIYCENVIHGYVIYLFIYLFVSTAYTEAVCDFPLSNRAIRLAQPSNTELQLSSVCFPTNYSLTLLTHGWNRLVKPICMKKNKEESR
jgi:hypothetical protein